MYSSDIMNLESQRHKLTKTKMMYFQTINTIAQLLMATI
jgi:hypothetical protein